MKKDHVEIILEDIKEKFEVILEGVASLNRKMDSFHESLSRKIEMNGLKIDALNKKVDGVAADLTAHRADTESHSKGYRISE